VRFLVDESLSARVARLLADAGHDAVHVGDLDLLGAPDTDVMAAARASGRSVTAADTDFGELLAIGRHPGPSVILFGERRIFPMSRRSWCLQPSTESKPTSMLAQWSYSVTAAPASVDCRSSSRHQ
jgi:predicted nuclease of predicted toxin-antitoxin system